MAFSRQEYWRGLPCPPAEHLPNPGIEPASLVPPNLQVDCLPLSHHRVSLQHDLTKMFWEYSGVKVREGVGGERGVEELGSLEGF